MTFESISARIMMIIMIFNLFKLIIDTMIRGYTFYTIYGWSARIFGASFTSTTTLLIHLGANTTNLEPATRSDVELNQIPYTSLPTDLSSKPMSSTYPSLNDLSAPSCITETIRQGSQFLNNNKKRRSHLFLDRFNSIYWWLFSQQIEWSTVTVGWDMYW